MIDLKCLPGIRADFFSHLRTFFESFNLLLIYPENVIIKCGNENAVIMVKRNLWK